MIEQKIALREAATDAAALRTDAAFWRASCERANNRVCELLEKKLGRRK